MYEVVFEIPNKLTKFASDEQIKSINLKRQDLKSFESQETIEIKTLEFLLENYNEKLMSGNIKDKIFSNEEQQKLSLEKQGCITADKLAVLQ